MNDIEKRIHRGMNQLAPDVFQNVLADTGPKLKSEVWLAQEEHKDSRNFWMRAARTAAVLAACCVLILGLAVYQISLKVDSVVEIDVNPSLELQLNRNAQVVRVNALNADGVKILDDTQENLKRAKLDEAIHVLVNTMVRDGFLNEEKNSVLVSVDHGDADKSEELQQLVAENVKEALSQDQITGIVYHQSYSTSATITEIAEEFGISPGKAAFIKRLITLRPDFSIEELAQLTISEITELLQKENVDVSQYVARNNRRQSKPQGREEPCADDGAETERFTAKLEDGREWHNWITTDKLCRDKTDRVSSIEKLKLEENLPADGVIIKEEVADMNQQSPGPEGNGTVISRPEDQVGGGQTAVEPEVEPEKDQNKPEEEDKPAPDEPEEEETEDPGQMGDGSGDTSQWEDVKGLPEKLRTQLEALIKSVDSLLAQMILLAPVEEDGSTSPEYAKCSALLLHARGQYESVKMQTAEMSASGELHGHCYQRALKILEKAEYKLDKAESRLKAYAPAS